MAVYGYIQKQINIDLKHLVSWLLANKISLNKTKTEVIIFRKPRQCIDSNICIKLNGHKISPSSTIKYLGIFLDETLNGNAQCSVVIDKLTRANSMLSIIRHYVPHDKLVSIYHALFASHMTYGCQIWGQNEKNLLFVQITRLQKRAIRLITFSPYDAHTDPLFKELKILKLEDQISLYNSLLVHDFSCDELPTSFDNYFTLCTELYDTDTRRHAGAVFVPQVSSKRYGRQSIKLSSILVWNHLTEVLDQNLFNLTKAKLKTTLTNHFLNSYS